MKRFLALSLGLLSFILLGVFSTSSSVNAVSVYDEPRYTDTADAFCAIPNNNVNTLLDLNEAINNRLDSDPDAFSDWDIYSVLDIYDSDRFYWIITITEPNTSSYTFSNAGQVNVTLIKKEAFNSFTFGRQNPTYDGGLRIDVDGFTSTYANENIAFFSISSFRPSSSSNRCTSDEHFLYYGLGALSNQNPDTGVGYIRATTFLRDASDPNVMSAGGFFDDFLYSRNFKSSIYLSTMPFTPPPGYEGTPPPSEILPDENLKPEFAYTVDKDGKLSWQYMGNIKPFLTGVFYTNVDSLNSDWTLDDTIHQVSSNPAGWLDETWTLPGAGYYQLLISHSQQLDNPPWTNQNFYIQPIVMQFYWDGSTAIRGDNTQCSATETCNPLLVNDPEKQGLFPNLNLPTYGLIEAVKSPLLFLSTLPSKMSSNACQPLSLPLPYMDENLVLPCMRPIYEEHFSGIYNLWSALIVSMFSYHMAISLFARIKADVNPKDDTIQVAQL